MSGFSKNTQISRFMKIGPIGAELFHADGRADMTKFCVFGSSCRRGLQGYKREVRRYLRSGPDFGIALISARAVRSVSACVQTLPESTADRPCSRVNLAKYG
jgi:hypothetical protein